MFTRDRKAEKGFVFPRLCEMLREVDGCPLCMIATRESENMLEMLFREGIMDPGLRTKLLKAGGFCNWHAWFSVQEIPTAAAGTAIVYRQLLETLLTRVVAVAGIVGKQRRRSLLSFVRRKESRLIRASRNCPVCDSIHKVESLYLHELLEFFDDPKVSEPFGRSFGLCLPHLQMTIDEFPRHSNLPRLLGAEREKFAALEQELAEFDRKRDYRFAAEPSGNEQTSWRRALELFVGKRGVFPRQSRPVAGDILGN